MFALLSALWLGLLTSVSPCPLATNLAAVGWLAGQGASPSRSVRAGVLYGLGRATSYALLGGSLTLGLLSAVSVSRWLQHDMNRLLGPLLIVVGMVLLELLPLRLPALDLQGAGRRVGSRGGSTSSFLLGALFALSFCPVSAALFFGSLLPLAAREASPWMLPAVFGVGTAVPVVVVAILVATGVQRAATLFERSREIERIARTVTGVSFVGVGLYLAWTHVLGPALRTV